MLQDKYPEWILCPMAVSYTPDTHSTQSMACQYPYHLSNALATQLFHEPHSLSHVLQNTGQAD